MYVCDSDCNSSCVLSAEDFKFLHYICHVKDCKLLQFDFDAVQKWFCENDGKLNVDNTTFIFQLLKHTVYTQVVNLIALVSLVKNVYKTWTHFQTMQLHLLIHVDHTAKQTLKLLVLLHYNSSYPCTTDGFTHVYCGLLQSKSEFAFVLTASFAVC